MKWTWATPPWGSPSRAPEQPRQRVDVRRRQYKFRAPHIHFGRVRLDTISFLLTDLQILSDMLWHFQEETLRNFVFKRIATVAIGSFPTSSLSRCSPRRSSCSNWVINPWNRLYSPWKSLANHKRGRVIWVTGPTELIRADENNTLAMGWVGCANWLMWCDTLGGGGRGRISMRGRWCFHNLFNPISNCSSAQIEQLIPKIGWLNGNFQRIVLGISTRNPDEWGEISPHQCNTVTLHQQGDFSVK